MNAFDRPGERYEPAEDARPPAFSDEALALRFAKRHAGDLRYVAAWGKWLQWTGNRWRVDDTKLAFDLARRLCREVAAECNEPKVATAIASAKTVAAVERLALADRRIAATTDQWDFDLWSLNTPDGVVDAGPGNCASMMRSDYPRSSRQSGRIAARRRSVLSNWVLGWQRSLIPATGAYRLICDRSRRTIPLTGGDDRARPGICFTRAASRCSESPSRRLRSVMDAIEPAFLDPPIAQNPSPAAQSDGVAAATNPAARSRALSPHALGDRRGSEAGMRAAKTQIFGGDVYRFQRRLRWRQKLDRSTYALPQGRELFADPSCNDEDPGSGAALSKRSGFARLTAEFALATLARARA